MKKRLTKKVMNKINWLKENIKTDTVIDNNFLHDFRYIMQIVRYIFPCRKFHYKNDIKYMIDQSTIVVTITKSYKDFDDTKNLLLSLCRFYNVYHKENIFNHSNWVVVKEIYNEMIKSSLWYILRKYLLSIQVQERYNNMEINYILDLIDSFLVVDIATEEAIYTALEFVRVKIVRTFMTDKLLKIYDKTPNNKRLTLLNKIAKLNNLHTNWFHDEGLDFYEIELNALRELVEDLKKWYRPYKAKIEILDTVSSI